MKTIDAKQSGRSTKKDRVAVAKRMLAYWERRLKIASNLAKKYRRRVRYYQRTLAKAEAEKC